MYGYHSYRKTFLGGGFYSFAVACAPWLEELGTTCRSAPFCAPFASFFPAQSPPRGGRTAAWIPAQLRICTNRTRFDRAQPFPKITSLPCVLTFRKTQPRPFPDSKGGIAGSGHFPWLGGVLFSPGLPEKSCSSGGCQHWLSSWRSAAPGSAGKPFLACVLGAQPCCTVRVGGVLGHPRQNWPWGAHIGDTVRSWGQGKGKK